MVAIFFPFCLKEFFEKEVTRRLLTTQRTAGKRRIAENRRAQLNKLI